MTTSNELSSLVNDTPTKEDNFCVRQDLFDLKSILNKVDTGNVSEPEMPTKSSTEILSELFGAFDAEPPKLPERVEQISQNGQDSTGRKEEEAETSLRSKKSKKSKKKHKHKDKKHKKKSKSSKKQATSEDSEDNSGKRKHKQSSERKKKKHSDSQAKETTVTDSKIMPVVEPVSVKITTDGSNNVKRTVECPSTESNSDKGQSVPAPPKQECVPVKPMDSDTKPPVEAASSETKTDIKEEAQPVAVQPKQTTTDAKTKLGPGRIVIKNLKFSSVFEETVRQVEEQAKLKAERYEEGEISEDSSDNKEASPVEDDPLVLSPERSTSPEKKERRKHCRKHSVEEKHHHRHHHHHHRSRSRSQDRDRDKRKRSRSHDRTHSRHHHQQSSRTRHGKKRSHSPESGSSHDGHHRDRQTKKRSRSNSKKRTRRSRSRSRHRSRSLSSGHIDKQKLLEIARKNAMNLLKQGVLPSSVVTQDKMVAIKAGGKSVAELTDFCKQLSKKEALGQVSSDSEGNDHPSSGSDTERPFHHPFQIKERPASIVMNIRNSVQLPVKTLQEKTAEQSKQLRIQFPVSSGQQHRKSENEWVPVSPKKEEPAATAVVTAKVAEPTKLPAEPVNQVFPNTMITEGLDIGSIVSQRLTAMRKLQENPNDVQALSEMYRAQKDMQMWAESKQQPGQFTGSTGARVLSAAELSSGFQAWAKKDQLTTASPVSGGMGMALLQKMGWRPGEGLGKNKEGTLEPLKLEIKMDKKGLVSQEELGRRPVPPVPQNPITKTLVGKHPVSLLVEFCSKRRWGVPQFELCFECGPDHRKNFLFKVRVNSNEYKPSVASPNKKQAKAEAATICLQAMGVLPP